MILVSDIQCLCHRHLHFQSQDLHHCSCPIQNQNHFRHFHPHSCYRLFLRYHPHHRCCRCPNQSCYHLMTHHFSYFHHLSHHRQKQIHCLRHPMCHHLQSRYHCHPHWNHPYLSHWNRYHHLNPLFALRHHLPSRYHHHPH